MVAASPTGRVVIAGGSGFLGTSLARHLAERDHSVTVLSRRTRRNNAHWQFVEWDGHTVGPWTSSLDGAVAVINLAGRSVDCRKTPDNVDEILRSRVESTRALGQAMRVVSNPPPVWVQMSTAHIYGDPPSVVCDEESPPGFGLAPFVAAAWEQEFEHGLLPSQRGVALRTSFVLGRDRGAGGGPLQRLRKITRWGLGGTIAGGRQGISWIHEHDFNRLVERAIVDNSMRGTYIASAPNPVAQREFARTLRTSLGVRVGLPATEWMVRLGARLVLNTDPELALYGRFVVSRRLEAEQFEFRFPQLRNALSDVLGRQREPAPTPSVVCKASHGH